MKADMHVHSKFSKRPSEWILKKLDCPESFTEPHNLYKICKQKGMSLVTITDHNVINGCLEIAHYPEVFISEEVTTYFPEDGCKLHVLVYNINEKKHGDIQKIRENVFELVAYLRENKIIHALAHPLYSVNSKLTPEHFEKCLLLFRNFELNGARKQSRCLNFRTHLGYIVLDCLSLNQEFTEGTSLLCIRYREIEHLLSQANTAEGNGHAAQVKHSKCNIQTLAFFSQNIGLRDADIIVLDVEVPRANANAGDLRELKRFGR